MLLNNILLEIYNHLHDNNVRDISGYPINVEDFLFRWFRIAYYGGGKYNFVANLSEEDVIKSFFEQLEQILDFYTTKTKKITHPTPENPCWDLVYDFTYKRLDSANEKNIVTVAKRKTIWATFLINELDDQFDSKEMSELKYPWNLAGLSFIDWVKGMTVVEIDIPKKTEEHITVESTPDDIIIEIDENVNENELTSPEGRKHLTEKVFDTLAPRLRKLNPFLTTKYEDEIKTMVENFLEEDNVTINFLQDKFRNNVAKHDEYLAMKFILPLLQK